MGNLTGPSKGYTTPRRVLNARNDMWSELMLLNVRNDMWSEFRLLDARNDIWSAFLLLNARNDMWSGLVLLDSRNEGHAHSRWGAHPYSRMHIMISG